MTERDKKWNHFTLGLQLGLEGRRLRTRGGVEPIPAAFFEVLPLSRRDLEVCGEEEGVVGALCMTEATAGVVGGVWTFAVGVGMCGTAPHEE